MTHPSTPRPEISADTAEQSDTAEQCDDAEELWWTFPARPEHARLARTWLSGWLESRGPGKEGKVHGALVAFSELATNAVLRGTGPITVFAKLANRQLLCEVTDRSLEMPTFLEPDRDHEHRRRLSLVDALTETWWVRAAPGGGKTLSFVVELDVD